MEKNIMFLRLGSVHIWKSQGKCVMGSGGYEQASGRYDIV